MKGSDTKRILLGFGVPIAATVLMVQTAWAAEGGGNWRATYDQVMLWVNFAIFTTVIIKYGRAPIRNFLKGKGREIATQIASLEQEKKAIDGKIHDARMQLDASAERMALIKEKIVEQGHRKKQQLIDQARRESQMMLESAKTKVGQQIREAHRTLRVELIDAAVERAIEQLPRHVTADDSRRLVDDFMAAAEHQL